MTSPERIQQRLPELMAELAPARVPDYFDDMLRQAARTPQRPAWRSPERWLAMGDLARPAPLGLPSWRPLIVLALVALALVTGIAVIAGARPVTLPPPYGLAANGSIVTSTVEGDIVAVDPDDGGVRALVVGETFDEGPWFSRDGTRFTFVRMEAPEVGALMVADADGANVRELLPPSRLGSWFDWSPDGDSILISDNPDQRTLLVVDATTGATQTIRLPVDVSWAEWRPGHDQIVLWAGPENQMRYYLAAADGTDLTPLPTAAGTINRPTLAPDGRRLVYTTWETGTPGQEGVIRAHDLDTNDDRILVPTDPGYTRLGPQLSPDGSRLLVERYDEEGYRIVVTPVDAIDEVALGDVHAGMSGGAMAAWSPDGTQVLVHYRNTGETWLFAADGSTAEPVDAVTELATWRRIAP